MASRGTAALNWAKKSGVGGSHSHEKQSTSIPRHIVSAIVFGIVSRIYSLATITAAAKFPAHVAALASKYSPSVLKGILYGIGLRTFGGSFWKVHHLNERRKTEEFYARLEAGEITLSAQK